MAAKAAYGVIKVSRINAGSPLVLTFTNRKVFDETEARLRAARLNVIDAFWGYQVHTSADEALADADMWLR
jgi:hypothetical protein